MFKKVTVKKLKTSSEALHFPTKYDSKFKLLFIFQCSQGGSSALLQTELDLSDLLHPETFLGALRQLASRMYGVPMDELRLDNTWARGGGSSKAKASIRVAGMLLEGESLKKVNSLY